ncbi:MAG: RND family transporter [Bacteroidetes bacterium]|nr:RND family transporter [Bacteroidota bacterium]
MWEKLGRFLRRNRRAVLAFWVVYVLVMAFLGRNVEVSYHFAKMLPADDSVYTEFVDLNKHFDQGSGGVVFLAAHDRAMFTPYILNSWIEMAKSIENTPEVENVLSWHNAVTLYLGPDSTDRFEALNICDGRIDTRAEAETLRAELNELPVYHGLMNSHDGNTQLMAVRISDTANYSKLFFPMIDHITAEAKKFERRTGIDVQISGVPYLRMVNARSIKSEINLFLGLTAIVTLIIMFAMMRSTRAALIALAVVGVGVVGSFGVLGALGYKLTLFSALIPPLLIVIVVPNCIFFINKYHQEYARDQDVDAAVQHTVKKIGGVALLTNLTTALGFSTFTLTSSDALVHFGIAATINIIVVYVLSITILPVLYSWLPAPRPQHYKHLDQKWLSDGVAWLERVAQHHRKWVYIGALTLAAAGGVGMLRMQTTGNITTDIDPADPLVQQMRFFEQELGGVIPLEVVINTREPGGVNSSSVLRQVEEFQRSLDTLPNMSRSLSVVDFMKFGRQAFYGGMPEFYELPTAAERRQIAALLPSGAADANAALTSGLVSADGQRMRITVQVRDLPRPEMVNVVKAIQANADAIFDRVQVDVSFSGAGLIFLRSTEYLIDNLIMSLIFAVVVISLLMAGLFRSWRMMVVAILPNLLPLIMTAGIMGWFGIPVKPSTVLIFSIAFGISVDDTLHLLSRYRQELLVNGGNIGRAALIAIRESGVSMFYTSVVLFAGFMIFLASNFGGTQALGLLVSITLGFAMFTNLLLLPSLLMSLDRVMSAKEQEHSLAELSEGE